MKKQRQLWLCSPANTIDKVQLSLWIIFSFGLSCFISFVAFLSMSLDYSGMHNYSTAGDHVPTERAIILSDILTDLKAVFFFLTLIGFFAIFTHNEVFNSLNPKNRKFRGFSVAGLWLFGINMFILFVGPLLASVSYYLERAPLFPN